MKVALVLCPAWSREMPHLALAILSASLRKNGHEVSPFDLNNDFYHNCAERYKPKWKREEDLFWVYSDCVSEFISGHEVMINEAVKNILATDASIIGFSVYSPTELMSLELARRIKKSDTSKVVIFGGPQCLRQNKGNLFIKDKSVDFVVLKEGDQTIIEIVDTIEKGGRVNFCEGTLLKKDGVIIDCGDRPPITDLDNLSFPDFSDFTPSLYERPDFLPALFSRGCIQKCVFCTVNNSWDIYRSLSGRRMFECIKYQLNSLGIVDKFYFYDPILNGCIKELHCFCDMVIEAVGKNEIRPIQWIGEAIIRPDMTAELLNKMKQAGCSHLAYGIESGSQKVLDLMKKSFKISDAENMIRHTYEAGIGVAVNFMFGFPTEEKEDFEDTLAFLKRIGKYINNVIPSESFCYIHKDTYLYNHAEEFGIPVLPDDNFWETVDGKNTYPERMRRFEEFCELAKALNIKMGSAYNRVRLTKKKNLEEYYLHKERHKSSPINSMARLN